MKQIHLLIFILIINIIACTAPQKTATPALEMKKENSKGPRTDAFLTELLNQYPQYFDTLLRQNATWNIQIIYTQIDRKANGRPHFTHYYYHVDPEQYYYPASTVKLPIAALALEKLNKLNIPQLSRQTTMITEKGTEDETEVYNDPSSVDGRPTVEQYIKKILLVSDNEAFNRLYEFLGQEYINGQLHHMGYDSIQILHRLNISLSEDQNRTTNPVTFYDTAAHSIYQQPMVKSNMAYQPRKNLLGKGYYNGNQLINEPFDFSKKNRFSLVDLHSILISLLFPDAVPSGQQFNLTEDDYQFLRQYMSMLPRESDFPQYDSTYNDAYAKFLYYGGHDAVDSNIRIYNKIGDAYGFLTDAAYIVDAKKGIEFLLSATISCNSDGIYNDDHYEYETVGLPFMKHLGRVIYGYEAKR